MSKHLPPRKLSPREVAALFGISPDKVLAWIHSGELQAVNVATRPGGRPRWRIDQADLMAFEQRRAATPPAPICRVRRKKQSGIIDFF